jgi:hypothetical protein
MSEIYGYHVLGALNAGGYIPYSNSETLQILKENPELAESYNANKGRINSMNDLAFIGSTIAISKLPAEEVKTNSSTEISKNTGLSGSKPANEITGNRLTTNESQLKHMFRNSEGHFPVNTAVNRGIIESAAGNTKNFLGVDSHGTNWYAETLPDGTQAWAKVRNGVITEGGFNQVPKTFNPQTGLSSPVKP